MASNGTLRVELVAADRVVWSGEATQIAARTSEGDLGVLVDHAPVLSVLVPGVVTIHSEGEVVAAVVEEGFLSVAENRVSILSEDAFLVDELDPAAVKAELEQARADEDEAAVRRAEAKLRGTELA
ncbi:F0F1 ATP synthase subunit epsilon [Aeromicrobium sp. CTD01-1L150]|uniref:F0F1 ATP synthase subunit epsilon n=1 Tax=Aeromicrobium sp. CTD01-1L150 TaxID=3341830 RepID=UPI0035C1F8D5